MPRLGEMIMAKTRKPRSQDYQPAGRMVPIFAASDGLGQDGITLALAKAAAARGETVLMLDAIGGALMDRAGIIYNKTLGDVIHRGAELRDVRYVTSNEHFTACACGDASIETVLGSMAALSLSYDWVFIGMEAGCTPAHVRLASAADAAILTYSAEGDKFMRAYWMMEAVRNRAPKFDPLILSTGPRDEAVETALMLTDTIRNFLGAPPPYAGHIQDSQVNARMLEQIVDQASRRAVA